MLFIKLYLDLKVQLYYYSNVSNFIQSQTIFPEHQLYWLLLLNVVRHTDIMSGRKTKIDSAAKSRIMSSEYKNKDWWEGH